MSSLPRIDLPQHELMLPISKKKVKYRPFVVKEEKIMLIAIEENNPEQVIEAINQIIINCTSEKCSIDNLPQLDVEYLFLNIRNKSLGNGVEVNAVCTSCDKNNQLNLDLSKATIKEGAKLEPEVKLNDDTWVVLKYPSVRETYKLTVDDSDDNIMSVLASSITTIIKGDQTYSTQDTPLPDVIDFVENLTQEQLAKINGYFENAPSIVFNDTFICKHCKVENDIKLEGLQNFFD